MDVRRRGRILLFLQCHPDRGRAKFRNLFGELGADFSPARPLGGGEVEKVQTLRVYSDGNQAFFNLLDSLGGVGISFQEMALTGQSASHEDAVDASLEGPQYINLVELASTGKADHFDAGGVGQPHDPG